MKKELPVRKDIRLKDYDYSHNGAYFITMCVKDGHKILWTRTHVGTRIARPLLSAIGKVIENSIENISCIYEAVNVDKYVIMPNHIHIIIKIDDKCGRAMRVPTISTVINQMKGYATKRLGYSIWQPRFHDHIIRDEESYQQIWQYVDKNPETWHEDCYYTI